ncbi:MAG TPA: fibronectin type III domain-containing protein, partial [Candidatus Kapabacteria bacterium]|nr:fibronectin type III domain-containing protein [Candidatus Kapabacteria bacterium]
LNVTAFDFGSVTLSWVDPSTNRSNFVIELKNETGSFSSIATVEPNVRSYKVTGLRGISHCMIRLIAND